MNSESGTTLIEVVLATVMITVVVLSLSMVFPKASKNISNNQHQLIAGNLVAGQLDTLKSQSYGTLDVTDPGLFGVSTASCDCSTDDFALMPSIPTHAGGMIFQVKSCVHFVTPNPGGSWPSHCPADGDTGYKIIRVRVSWMHGNTPYKVEQKSLKPRE